MLRACLSDFRQPGLPGLGDFTGPETATVYESVSPQTLYHDAKMLACKGIFARPSMPQPCVSTGRHEPQRLAVARSPSHWSLAHRAKLGDTVIIPQLRGTLQYPPQLSVGASPGESRTPFEERKSTDLRCFFAAALYYALTNAS